MTAEPAQRLRPSRPRVSSPTLRIASLALMITGLGMIASALVETVDGGGDILELGSAGFLTVLCGASGWGSTRLPTQISNVSAFAAVAWSWIAISVFGTLPYLFTGAITQLDGALFESISGFSCTGSTILPDIDSTGQGLLFWRNLTQWFGGMGLIVLAVAVLPILGVGGLGLLSAEAPGPESEALTPRVSETAKRLWLVYAAITGAVAIALLLAGLDPYDAVTHSFTALATGGFSPHNASIAHFDSAVVEVILIVGMLLGATSFTLHMRFLRGDRRAYWRVSEFRMFVYLILGASTIVGIVVRNRHDDVFGVIREASFNVVSIFTSTGFGTTDYTEWAVAGQAVLLLLMIPAAMTGSTSGGFKLLRLQIVLRHAARELSRVRHPRAVLPLRLGQTVVAESTAVRAIAFVILFLMLLFGGGLLVTALGADPTTAFGGAATTLSGVGPAFGEAGPAGNFLAFTRPARAVLMVLMLFGRLEIFPMLFMFTAAARSMEQRRARRLRRPAKPAPALHR